MSIIYDVKFKNRRCGVVIILARLTRNRWILLRRELEPHYWLPFSHTTRHFTLIAEYWLVPGSNYSVTYISACVPEQWLRKCYDAVEVLWITCVYIGYNHYMYENHPGHLRLTYYVCGITRGSSDWIITCTKYSDPDPMKDDDRSNRQTKRNLLKMIALVLWLLVPVFISKLTC